MALLANMHYYVYHKQTIHHDSMPSHHTPAQSYTTQPTTFPTSSTTPIYLAPSTPDLYSFPPSQHHKRSSQPLLTISSSFHKLLSQSCQASAPANWQSPSQFFFYLSNLLHQLSASLSFTLRHCIHCRCEEQPDCFIDMFFCRNVG